MGKVLVDIDIWMDIIFNQPEFIDESRAALMVCIDEDDEILVAATSLNDVFNQVLAAAGTEAAYRAVELIVEMASPAQVDAIVCKDALTLRQDSYDHGISAACARAESAKAVITRNKSPFRDVGITAYTPAEYLAANGYKSISL